MRITAEGTNRLTCTKNRV